MSSAEAAAVPRASAEPGILADLMDLTKARLNLLVLITTFVGFWMGSHGEIAWLRLIQAMLGIYAFAPAHTLVLVRPRLPEWLPRVLVRRIRVGDGRVSLRFERGRDGYAGAEIVERSGTLFVLDVPPPQNAGAMLGNGSAISAQDTVPFTLWCAASYLNDYKPALWAAASAGRRRYQLRDRRRDRGRGGRPGRVQRQHRRADRGDRRVPWQ